jgi:enoyl-CoA hydratase
MQESINAATIIASMSQPAIMMIKESVNRAYEGSLSDGLQFERRLFQSSFATEDQKEGMKAFIEKRPAKFSNK